MRPDLAREALAGPLTLFLALSTGCGYIGYPAVPLANIPARVTDLAAVERDGVVIVHYTVPTHTTENVLIAKPVSLDLRIGPTGEKFNAEQWAGQAKEVSNPKLQDGLATYEIPAREWVGKEVTIGVRSVGANRKTSDWSNFENLTIVAPPAPPSKPAIADVPTGERVTWTGAGEQFRVLRRAEGEPNFSVVATVKEHEWTDTAIDYGKSYEYEIQALIPAGKDRMAESDLSPPESKVAKDIFPPAVPSSVRADLTPNSISLVWDPDTDADLAGYRVYRSEGTGPWQKIAEINTVPSYNDTAVEHGKTYHYAVSAFDKATPPNESERSAPPVEVIFP